MPDGSLPAEEAIPIIRKGRAGNRPVERDKNMEMAETVQLTKEQNLMELVELLRKHNMKEAANSIFEMAAYVDVMEKKMDSVLEMIKKPFQAKRKLLSGILNCVNAAIEKTEQLAADVRQYQTDKEERETGSVVNMEAVNSIDLARVAEPEFQYVAEAFEAYERGNKEKAADTLAKEARKPAVAKSR